MQFIEALHYLDSFQNFEKKTSYDYKSSFNLDRIKELCAALGNPQKNFKSVLVVGTNGKGSTASILNSILLESGHRTGLYTSPHLVDLRERIKINGLEISKRAFSGAISRIRKTLGGGSLKECHYTYFEILTVATFLLFSKERIDLAILEAGLGGRLDATNVVEPELVLITKIGLDHTKILGDSISDIASEKAAVIRRSGLVVSAKQTKEVTSVIDRRVKDLGAISFILGREFSFSATDLTLQRTTFDYIGIESNYTRLRLNLIGLHQCENASIAIAAAELLKSKFGFAISKKDILKGLKSVLWKGRLQSISDRPRIFLDGLHNIDSAKALIKTFDLCSVKEIDVLVFAASKDKDVKKVGLALCKRAKSIIFTSFESERAMDAFKLSKVLAGSCKDFMVDPNPKHALRRAKDSVSKKGTILVAGSLFLVGEILK